MQIGESDNSVEQSAGNDSANPPTDLDNLPDIADDEPEAANEVGSEQGAEGESETGATEDGQEPEESASTEEQNEDTESETEGAEKKTAAEVKDDIIVPLPSGEKVALGELKSGYLRQADYSRKTQTLSEQRKGLEALSSRVNQSVDAIANLMAEMIPPMPEVALSMSEPARYVSEKAMHEAAMARFQQAMNLSSGPKEVANKLTQEQHSELLQSEAAKLAEAFPQTASHEGRQKFLSTAAEAARELGYSEAEISRQTDHRLFKLAHYAKIGMQAEKARAIAKQKVADVPPVAQQKRPQPKNNAGNREAMSRLAQTGSLKDAMRVEFD